VISVKQVSSSSLTSADGGPESKTWLYLAIAFHLACSAVLMPVTSHPYDLAGITGPVQAWLTWGVSPFYNWKFGLDFTALVALAHALASLLSRLGAPGIVALHLAWKLPLVAANLGTAGAIYRLARRFAPKRAVLLAVLWLVNPVVLWVSAGHGQVESIGILCLLVALELALEGRLFIAGLVTGLGVGIEYFPLAALGAVVVLWRGGQLTGRRALLAYGGGLSVSLAMCFAPLLLDPVGRAGLVGGLVYSAGYSPQLPGYTSQPTHSLLAVWAWVGYRWSNAWPILFGISGLIFLALAWRFARRGPKIAPLFLSAVLLLAVLLDANALPQFAIVAAAGLWLLALVVEVPPLVMIALPTAGIATYFLFLDYGQSTANAFFYDVWATVGARLWVVPESEPAAVFLGHLFSLGLIATAVYTVARLGRPSRWGGIGATVAGVGLCMLLVIWASQPSVWLAAIGGSSSANLPAFDSFVAIRDGSTVALESDSYKVTYPETLLAAASSGSVRPLAGLRLFVSDLITRTNGGIAREPQLWPDHSVVIPDWKRIQPSIESLWVVLLVGSPGWSEESPPKASGLFVQIGGARVPADAAVFSNELNGVGWALVDFRVPAQLVDNKGRLEITINPSTLLLKGSSAGPWVRVLPASGPLRTLVDLAPINATYNLNTQGQGYLLGLPLRTPYIVSIDRANASSFEVQGAVVIWPQTSESWKHNPWFQMLGATFGWSLLFTMAWLVAIYIRRAAGGESSQSARAGSLN
jgi:hypothetical protein